MTDGAAWSMSSALIMASDLERSVRFYVDVCRLQEIYREPDVVILGVEGGQTATLYLRRVHRGGLHPGQETLGARGISFYSSSTTELDRVEERLKALDALRDRRQLGEGGSLGLVRGHDPDRLPLAFVNHDPSRPLTGADYGVAASLVFGWDL